jgi:hypothetical protein
MSTGGGTDLESTNTAGVALACVACKHTRLLNQRHPLLPPTSPPHPHPHPHPHRVACSCPPPSPAGKSGASSGSGLSSSAPSSPRLEAAATNAALAGITPTAVTFEVCGCGWVGGPALWEIRQSKGIQYVGSQRESWVECRGRVQWNPPPLPHTHFLQPKPAPPPLPPPTGLCIVCSCPHPASPQLPLPPLPLLSCYTHTHPLPPPRHTQGFAALMEEALAVRRGPREYLAPSPPPPPAPEGPFHPKIAERSKQLAARLRPAVRGGAGWDAAARAAGWLVATCEDPHPSPHPPSPHMHTAGRVPCAFVTPCQSWSSSIRLPLPSPSHAPPPAPHTHRVSLCTRCCTRRAARRGGGWRPSAQQQRRRRWRPAPSRPTWWQMGRASRRGPS